MAELAPQVEAASQAVIAALDLNSSPEARQAATSYLDSLKAGDVRLLGVIAFTLTKEERPSEVRHFGFKMLQHLVRIRWEELSTVERRQMASMAVDMIEDMVKPYEEWVLKSQAASLLAEVARREGPRYLKETLPTFFELSSKSPMHAELVAMMLRWLPEDVTIHNEDLEGERRRQLLSALTHSLSETLPFLYKLLDHYFGAAVTSVQQNQLHMARQHAAAVTAAVNALLAYAEWAPVTAMASYGLIEACGFLLSSLEFRLSACEFLKLVASRRRPADEAAEVFDSAMVRVFEVLSTASEGSFKHSASHIKASTGGGLVDESEIEFAGCLCEAMVALGSHNLYSIKGDKPKLTIYLQQMLMFFQHQRLVLHAHALPLWLMLLRDLTAPTVDIKEPDKSGRPNFGTEASFTQPDKDNKSGVEPIPLDIYTILLDVAFQRILKRNVEKGAGLKGANNENEDWADEFSAPNDFSQYRSRLIELIRLIAAQQPVVAVSKIAQRLEVVLHAPILELSSLEGTQTMLETIVNAIPEGIMAASAITSTTQREFTIIMEVEWKEPPLVELLGRHFDAIGPYLRFSPAAVPLVIQKIFILLTSVPLEKNSAALASTRTRLQVCTSFLRIARAAGPTLLPHMQAMAETMTSLQGQGLLLRGEHNLLGEALLVAASAAGREHQKQVLEWLLGPIREQWLQTEWQNQYLSGPGGLIQLVTFEQSQSSGEREVKRNEEMWFIFHSVALFERALRRCSGPTTGLDGSPLKEGIGSQLDPSSIPEIHPMLQHLSWIFPPLLKLLRCIHSLWSPAIIPTLPIWIREALPMGISEQTALLGELALRSVAGDGNPSDEPFSGVSRVDEIRNWLKGIRDSGYNVLGLAAARIGDSFFNDADGRVTTLATCLLENLSSMEFRHIRQLLHSTILPLVKACPPMQWGPWLGNIVPPILIHCQQVLPAAWNNLIKEGAVKPPAISSVGGLTGLKTEVMEEKLLRDLTRETCNLLSVLASPQLKQGQRTADQPSQTKAVVDNEETARSLPRTSQSMLWCTMPQGAAASASLKLGIEALKWPDSEAVHKAIAFCIAIVSIATNSNDSGLLDMVGVDMLTAVIQGLTLESHATAQAELLGLFREIYVRLSGYTSSPQQVLLTLPSITTETLAAFDTALKKTSSVKEQRQHIKSLLLAAGGDHFKALKFQKNTNVITNVSNASLLAGQGNHKVRHEDVGSIGLAAIL
ncbi:hypothetical protein O6H91_13G072100 [Diphasiastrum complanatum]|uniref:Uncharacterized protein n=1 Tax=Diphasiastrum complanatum TaxID=34168 RepID=A0ACC2BW22_DIPCM|nr:hypothetical protein O6H91_13G072100 [Diphasiastrum complanatum]